MDKKWVKSIADVEARREVKGHEKRVHGMKAGGATGVMVRGGKAQTKGKMARGSMG